jgi:exodeoxyribonuclease VII small subunit
MRREQGGTMKKEMEKQPYEKLLVRLEEIVSRLEKGEVELERSIDQYEEGIALYGECSKRLRDAEQRLLKVTRKGEEISLEALEGQFSPDAGAHAPLKGAQGDKE